MTRSMTRSRNCDCLRPMTFQSLDREKYIQINSLSILRTEFRFRRRTSRLHRCLLLLLLLQLLLFQLLLFEFVDVGQFEFGKFDFISRRDVFENVLSDGKPKDVLFAERTLTGRCSTAMSTSPRKNQLFIHQRENLFRERIVHSLMLRGLLKFHLNREREKDDDREKR